MNDPTTAIFTFLSENQTFAIKSTLVASEPFSIIRRGIFSLLNIFQELESEQPYDISERLRVFFCELLTVPVSIDESYSNTVSQILGPFHSAEARWGTEVFGHYQNLLESLNVIAQIESPARLELRNKIASLEKEGADYKIYCHRRARSAFDSFFDRMECTTRLSDQHFLHSASDYHKAVPFDILLKFGPLRSRGWGSTPDALFSAPRFFEIQQVMWNGSKNETDFGYDPVLVAAQVYARSTCNPPTLPLSASWRQETEIIGNVEGASSIEDFHDEQILTRPKISATELHDATLIVLGHDRGILYPPHADILSYDANATTDAPVDLRSLDNDILEGMYLILPEIEELDFGALSVKRSQNSVVWKQKLIQEMRKNRAKLLKDLRLAGLNLIHLDNAIDRWSETPTSVIHAPQLASHFAILIKVIGLGDAVAVVAKGKKEPWWRLAWREIQKSRSDAIETGVVEKELFRAQAIEYLKYETQLIRDKSAQFDDFEISVSEWNNLEGRFLFNRIVSIERSFRAPQSEFKILAELSELDRWRE